MKKSLESTVSSKKDKDKETKPRRIRMTTLMEEWELKLLVKQMDKDNPRRSQDQRVLPRELCHSSNLMLDKIKSLWVVELLMRIYKLLKLSTLKCVNSRLIKELPLRIYRDRAKIKGLVEI